MDSIEIKLNNDTYFKYNDKEYDYSYAVKRDIKNILFEALESHKDQFLDLYDINTLKPNEVRLFIDENKKPIFCMVLYLINYKNETSGRYACGDYYPVNNEYSYVQPHNFQASICW